MLKKKIWASFQRIIELFTQKIVTKFSKIWVWDPGGQKGTGSRIRIRNTGFSQSKNQLEGLITALEEGNLYDFSCIAVY
jgi:hypothetical protein